MKKILNTGVISLLAMMIMAFSGCETGLTVNDSNNSNGSGSESGFSFSDLYSRLSSVETELATLRSSLNLSDSSNGNLIVTLQTEVAALRQIAAPVGSIISWHGSQTDTNGSSLSVPDGWVECNGGTVSDTDSILFGRPIPDLNSSGQFLRGSSTSGVFQDDLMQNHNHTDSGHAHNYQYLDEGDSNTHQLDDAYYRAVFVTGTTASGKANLGGPTLYGGNDPRVGNETRPVNMSVIWIMRVK
ncbi:MAG: tail fiber protein [bacterium]|nr:tail fiber protein [bacterium]